MQSTLPFVEDRRASFIGLSHCKDKIRIAKTESGSTPYVSTASTSKACPLLTLKLQASASKVMYNFFYILLLQRKYQ